MRRRLTSGAVNELCSCADQVRSTDDPRVMGIWNVRCRLIGLLDGIGFWARRDLHGEYESDDEATNADRARRSGAKGKKSQNRVAKSSSRSSAASSDVQSDSIDLSSLSLTGDRVCAACGEPMGELPPAKGAPPGAPLFAHLLDDAVECDAPAPVRSDADSGEAGRRRLDAFDERTAPLIDALGRGGAEAVVRAAVHPLAADTWEAIEEACGLDPLPNT